MAWAKLRAGLSRAQPFLILAALLLGAGLGTRASISLTVSPSRFEASLKAGDLYDSAFLVVNPGDQPITVVWDADDFSTDPETGAPVRKPKGSTSRSAAAWMRFETNQAKLSPNDRTLVKYYLDVPKGASGGYYALVTFRIILTPEQQGTIGASIQPAIVAKLLFSVGSKGKSLWKAQDLGVQIEPTTRIAEAHFTIRAEGSLHVEPEGLLRIKDANGKEIRTVSIRKDYPILPGCERHYRIPLGKLAAGTYRLLCVLGAPSSAPVILQSGFAIEGNGAPLEK